MPNFQLPIGSTKVIDIVENYQGNPSPDPILPTLSLGNQFPAGSITVNLVDNRPNTPPFKAQLTSVAGTGPQTGLTMTAAINPGGPSGVFTFDTFYAVDAFVFTPE